MESHKIQISVDLDQDIEEYRGISCVSETIDDIESSLESKTLVLRNQKRKVVGKFVACLCFENNVKKLKLVAEVEP